MSEREHEQLLLEVEVREADRLEVELDQYSKEARSIIKAIENQVLRLRFLALKQEAIECQAFARIASEPPVSYEEAIELNRIAGEAMTHFLGNTEAADDLTDILDTYKS